MVSFPLPHPRSIQYLRFEDAINNVRDALVGEGVLGKNDKELWNYIQSRKSKELLDAQTALSKEDFKKWLSQHFTAELLSINVQEYIDNILNPMIVYMPSAFVNACRSLAMKLKGIIACEGMDAMASLYDIRLDSQGDNMSEMDGIKFSVVKWEIGKIPLSLWLYGTKGGAVWWAYYRMLTLSGKRQEYGGKYRSKAGKIVYRRKIVIETLPPEDESEDTERGLVEPDLVRGLEQLKGKKLGTPEEEKVTIHEYEGEERFMSGETADKPDWMPREEERVRGELLNDRDRDTAAYWSAALDKDLPMEGRKKAKRMLMDEFESIKDMVNWINDKINMLLKHYRKATARGGWVRHEEPLPKLFDNIIRRSKDKKERRVWNIQEHAPEVLEELLSL
jgi:hypothetical protein